MIDVACERSRLTDFVSGMHLCIRKATTVSASMISRRETFEKAIVKYVQKTERDCWHMKISHTVLRIQPFSP